MSDRINPENPSTEVVDMILFVYRGSVKREGGGWVIHFNPVRGARAKALDALLADGYIAVPPNSSRPVQVTQDKGMPAVIKWEP